MSITVKSSENVFTYDKQRLINLGDKNVNPENCSLYNRVFLYRFIHLWLSLQRSFPESWPQRFRIIAFLVLLSSLLIFEISSLESLPSQEYSFIIKKLVKLKLTISILIIDQQL